MLLKVNKKKRRFLFSKPELEKNKEIKNLEKSSIDTGKKK